MPLVLQEGCFTDFYPTLADQGYIFLKLLCQISKPSELLCSQLEVTIRNRAGYSDNQKSGNSLSVETISRAVDFWAICETAAGSPKSNAETERILQVS